jgi:potassium channel subfamily K protein 1
MVFCFLSDDDLEKLIEEVVKASNRGVSAARNASGEPNWSFGQSLFFSSTVVTTIGTNSVSICSNSLKTVSFRPIELSKHH